MPYSPYEWPTIPPDTGAVRRVLGGDMMQFYAGSNPTGFVRMGTSAPGDITFHVDGGDEDSMPNGRLPNIDGGETGGLDGGGPGALPRDPHGLYRVITPMVFGSLDVQRVYDAGSEIPGTIIRGCLLSANTQTPSVGDVGIVKRTGDRAHTFLPVPGVIPSLELLLPNSAGCLAWKGGGTAGVPIDLAEWKDTLLGAPMRTILSKNDALGDWEHNPTLRSGFLVKYVTTIAASSITSLDFLGEVGDDTAWNKTMWSWNGVSFDLLKAVAGAGRHTLVYSESTPAVYIIGGEIHVLYTHVTVGPTLSFYFGSVTVNHT